jgi:nickel transport protein
MRRLAETGRPCLHAVLALLLVASAGFASSHEVQHEIVQGNAVMVRLVYADGEPFAYEQYELFAKGRAQPVQTGRSDSRGRVVFAPDDTTSWRLRTFSADGHGADFTFEAKADGTAAPVAAPPSRSTRLLFGLSAILVLFAALQLFWRRRKPA